MAHRFNPEHIGKLESAERQQLLPIEEILSDFPLDKQDIVADMGAGTGYFTLPLSQKVRQVIAVDIEPKMLSYLFEKLNRENIRNVQTVQSDMEQTPLANEVCDKLLCSLVMHELEDVERGAGEFYRVLKRGGRALIIDRKKEPMTEGPPVEHRLDAQTLMTIMKRQGFTVEKEKEIHPFYVIDLRK